MAQDGSDTQSSEPELMRRLAEGNTSALSELVIRHQAGILNLACRATGDAALAEEIGQEVFLRVWRAASTYEPRTNFKTWLYRITTNLCLDALKKRRPLSLSQNLGDDPRAADPSDAAQHRERIAAVRRVVADLPDRHRAVLILHRFCGMSIPEVAETTGWTESAVESLLVRSYRQLRQALRGVVE